MSLSRSQMDTTSTLWTHRTSLRSTLPAPLSPSNPPVVRTHPFPCRLLMHIPDTTYFFFLLQLLSRRPLVVLLLQLHLVLLLLPVPATAAAVAPLLLLPQVELKRTELSLLVLKESWVPLQFVVLPPSLPSSYRHDLKQIFGRTTTR